jgi:predicted ribosomally synthesized peptide with SipW-like signal peptide
MTRVSVLLIIICCVGILLLVAPTPTGAWFSDTETIEGISIATGSWSDAGSLVVTADQALLKPPAGSHAKTVLSGITAGNTGSTPLEITGVRVSWWPDDGEMIRQVAFTRGKGGEAPRAGPEESGPAPGAGGEGFTAFWSGEAASGRTLDGRFLLDPSTHNDPARGVLLSFDSNMEGKSLVCTLILDGGSEKGVRVQL